MTLFYYYPTIEKIHDALLEMLRSIVIKRHGINDMMNSTNDVTLVLERGNSRVIDTWTTTSIITGSPCTCRLIEIMDVIIMQIISLEDHSTHKETVIQVPPDIDSAKGAVAWTFGMTEAEYVCLVES